MQPTQPTPQQMAPQAQPIQSVQPIPQAPQAPQAPRDPQAPQPVIAKAPVATGTPVVAGAASAVAGYRLLTARRSSPNRQDDLDDLTRQVMELVGADEGWSPLGGPLFLADGLGSAGHALIQAMVQSGDGARVAAEKQAAKTK